MENTAQDNTEITSASLPSILAESGCASVARARKLVV